MFSDFQCKKIPGKNIFSDFKFLTEELQSENILFPGNLKI